MLAPPSSRTAVVCLVCLGLLPGLLAGLACGPDTDLRTCTPEAMGSIADWRTDEEPGVPDCEDAPVVPLGACVEGTFFGGPGARAGTRELTGTVIEQGTGAPPVSCDDTNTIGEMYGPSGELLVPPEWIQWVRIDEGAGTRVIAMVVPELDSTLEVGDSVAVWLEWDLLDSYLFELSDPLGPRWWVAQNEDIEPLGYAPGCPTLRLGQASCDEDRGPFGILRHYAIAIDGVQLPPGSRTTVDGMRFVNGQQWQQRGPCEASDCTGAWRVLAAIREDD